MSSGMDLDGQAQRVYQQYTDRSQNAMQNYGASAMAARFRHPSSIQASPIVEASQSFGEHNQGYADTSQYPSGPLQSTFHYPQFTAAESLGYTAQQNNTAGQYNQSYLYGQQATSSTDQASQEHMQRYQSVVGRNASVTSNSSQYSIPTPQSQYFGSSQSNQYPTRTGDVSSHGTSPAFESLSYTQSSGYNMNFQTSGQMLPPSGFAGYRSDQLVNSASLPSGADEAYETFQIKAREVFTLVKEGRLQETRDHLLHISHYLLGNAEGLGLDKDDKTLYDERLKLWETFNNTWLTTLQAQFDVSQEMILHGGHRLQPPRSLLSADNMDELGHELVRLCDRISVFGLVDYQMGVAEEEILELLIKCLDLIAPQSADTPRAHDPQQAR